MGRGALLIFLSSSIPRFRRIGRSCDRGTANRPTMLQLYARQCRSLLANLIEAE